MKIRNYIRFCLMAIIVAYNPLLAEDKYPYVGQVVGENVNIRAGAGVNHYRCGRLSEPETVVVVGEQFGFAEIKPPKGSFSWVAKRYVEKKNDSVGEVNADSVRVWAGSPYVSAIHSSSSQVELNTGDEVTFAGLEEGDYYKILPPEGASLWISAAHIKNLGPLSKFVPAKDKDIPSEPQVVEENADKAVVEGKEIALDKPLSEEIEQAEQKPAEDKQPEAPQKAEQAQSPKHKSQELQAIDEYLEIYAKVLEEREKPLAVQDYTEFVERLEVIADVPANGRAVKFAEALLDLVGRYQAAQLADKAVSQQDSELIRIRSEIQKQRKQQAEKIGSTAGFLIVGTLSRSYVYTTESGEFRYAVRDEEDSIIAYAAPVNSQLRNRAERLIGKKVGFDGKVVPDSDTSKVVINFTDIREIWQPNKE